jgi:hypothetical protein
MSEAEEEKREWYNRSLQLVDCSGDNFGRW